LHRKPRQTQFFNSLIDELKRDGIVEEVSQKNKNGKLLKLKDKLLPQKHVQAQDESAC
jgi:biotin operon repressor